MSPPPSHLPQDRSAYIPPRVQQEMAKHMQQTLPANLQYYQKSGAYVPPNVQKQMAQHMERSMPEHLKQYINPYMQQQVVPQHLGPAPGGQATHFTPHPSPSYTPNQQPGHTFEVQPNAAPQPQLQPMTPQTQSLQPQPQLQPQLQMQQQPLAAQPQVVSTPQQPYAFITDPGNPVKPSSPLRSLLGGNGKSLRTRLAIWGGGLVALLIILNILKGLVAGSFDLQPFLGVLQDQQELINLTSSSFQVQPGQTALPAAYQNFLATTQLTVTSSQTQLLTYLTANKQKVSPKELGARGSTAIDTQLSSAVASNTYASTFQQIMTSQLTTYRADLRTAYTQTSGKKGRAQLSGDYTQVQLLIKQLNQVGS